MINAVPSSGSSSPGAMPNQPGMNAGKSPSIPGESPVSPGNQAHNAAQSQDSIQTTPPSHPDLNTTKTHSPSESNQLAASPHGQAGRFADDLARKVQGKDASQGMNPSNPTTPPGMPTPPPFNPTYPDKSLEEINQTQQAGANQGKSHFGRNAILSALVLGLVVFGGGATYYLMQQNQDIRQQAASEEVTQTERYQEQADWISFNEKWQTIMNDETKGWEDFVAYAMGEGARYECKAPIMTVDQETLYGCDLNALFILYEPQAYIQATAISPQDSTLNSVLDGLITNSALLQEGKNQGLISLTSNIFNSPDKDMFSRLAAVKSMRTVFEDQLEKRVDFEVITIYFHNQVDPLIPLEEAKAVAKAKMDILYERLKAGEITMEQAGAEIAADQIVGDTTGVSLSQLDPIYDKNAYISRIGHKFNARIFKDPVYDDELRSLGEGQISTVRLCKDYKFTQEELAASEASGEELNAPMVESCYVIFKVNKINYGLIPAESEELNVESFLQNTYDKKTSINQENLAQ